MKIIFKSPDPRAGMVAQMDSGARGRQLIASGCAVLVTDSPPLAVIADPRPLRQTKKRTIAE